MVLSTLDSTTGTSGQSCWVDNPAKPPVPDMNPVDNPFAPGAGTAPPELAGRDALREKMSLCIKRLRKGRPAKSMMLVGLHGVGKTVLLDQMMKDAVTDGVLTIRAEATEGRSLPAMLAPKLRLGLLKLTEIDAARDIAVRGLRALAGFASSLRLVYGDIEVVLDYESEPGLADNGDLEADLTALLVQVGAAAAAAGTLAAIFIDELQYVEEPQMAALIAALHRCAQLQLPLTVVGAGLPQLRARMGEAKSYAERLFEFTFIGPLPPHDAATAIEKPIREKGADVESEAVELIVRYTHGYPYFLQEWGKHAWDIARTSPITSEDVETASAEAIATLDESFFSVRFDRLAPPEKRYLRAMASLGPGPHRSSDIAAVLSRDSTSLAPIRSSLIAKGMVWSPTYADTAFSVPLFDEFMLRIMPGAAWAGTDA